MRFLVDAQLPPALARRPEALGHAAEHVADLNMTTTPDSGIREYAAAARAVIITKDEDFAVWQLLPGRPAVVWLKLRNTRRAALLERVELELSAMIHARRRLPHSNHVRWHPGNLG